MTSEPRTDTTEKPWASNRLGDPRQLLHEATHLEELAQQKRREAQRLRTMADAEDAAAVRVDEVARDYRQWVKERETNVTQP
jgi:hypothetical protein